MGHKIEGTSKQVCVRLAEETLSEAEVVAERLQTMRADVLRQAIEVGIKVLAKRKPVAPAKETTRTKRAKSDKPAKKKASAKPTKKGGKTKKASKS